MIICHNYSLSSLTGRNIENLNYKGNVMNELDFGKFLGTVNGV